MLNERAARPTRVGIPVSLPITARSSAEQSGWLLTSRSGVRISPGRPSSVLGIVAVHPAFNRKRGVRFSQDGPFAAVAQRSRARPCEGRGHKFESCQPRQILTAYYPRINKLGMVNPLFILFSTFVDYSYFSDKYNFQIEEASEALLEQVIKPSWQ